MNILYKDSKYNFVYFDSFMFKNNEYKIGSLIKIKDPYNKYHIKNNETYILSHYKDNLGIDVYEVFSSYNYNGLPNTITIKNDPNEWIEEVNEDNCDNVCKKEKEKYFDVDNDDLKMGWLIYILAMAFFYIFKDRVLIWIALSCYFFYWRNKKLRS